MYKSPAQSKSFRFFYTEGIIVVMPNFHQIMYYVLTWSQAV